MIVKGSAGHDDQPSTKGWYKAKIREGVQGANGCLSSDFLDWTGRCLGQIVYRKDRKKYKILFETKEDFVTYMLTFDELVASGTDVGMFYCPYVPLITASAVSTLGNPSISFRTRYS